MYETTDLHLAAYLKSKGNVVGCRRDKKCYFVFEEEARNQVPEYFNNAQIGVTDYVNALQNLKTLMYNS